MKTKRPKLNSMQLALVRTWLRTPEGSWPETVQAYFQADDELPWGFHPQNFTDLVPREEWDQSRREQFTP
jgi:hypothetical protein